MSRESSYLDVKSPWNHAVFVELNDHLKLSTQYLYGSQLAIAAHITVNPSQPPLLGGKELAPVPMRLREPNPTTAENNNEVAIRKVLAADNFKIHSLDFNHNHVDVVVTNTKFRSIAQALGRLTSTLQRFASDNVTFAKYPLFRKICMQQLSIDLGKVTGCSLILRTHMIMTYNQTFRRG